MYECNKITLLSHFPPFLSLINEPSSAANTPLMQLHPGNAFKASFFVLFLLVRVRIRRSPNIMWIYISMAWTTYLFTFDDFILNKQFTNFS